MSARVSWVGMDQLITNLEHLPANLTAYGDHITARWAAAAADVVRTAYEAHRVTGHLARGVRIAPIPYGFAVRNTAQHAHLFEFGTRGGRRRSYTGTDTLGRVFAGADRGPMPGANIFIPAMIRARNAMRRDLAQLLRQEGFAVIIQEGTPGAA